MEEHQVEEQWSFAAGAQLFQQGEPRYDTSVCVCFIVVSPHITHTDLITGLFVSGLRLFSSRTFK